MDKKAIIKYCKELGCCDACCIRYLGHRNPAAFENAHEFLKKLLGAEDERSPEPTPGEPSSADAATMSPSAPDGQCGEYKEEKCENGCDVELQDNIEARKEAGGGRSDDTTPGNAGIDANIEENAGNGVNVDKNGAEECNIDENEDEGTPAKRGRRGDVCYTCLGMLQEEGWALAVRRARHEMEVKGYECTTFACALSAPISTALREKAVSLRLRARFPQLEAAPTPLKEAWKWAFCAPHLARQLGLRLESGAVAALLLAFTMEYAYEARELGALAAAAGGARRPRSRRELDACLAALRELPARAAPPAPHDPALCAAVRATHDPAYIGGRYVKLSRSLPQTPWVVHGERVMPSSVQEVLFAPIAALFGVPLDAVDRRLKLVAAGREDVDVRCLGDGRPFAVEISDPRFTATEQQLRALADQISQSEQVKVKVLRNVSKSQLSELKKGEESKLKSYEALCIKLRHTEEDIAGGAAGGAPQVSARDVARINALVPPALAVRQRTPLRVLHRRPLHARARRLLELHAAPVPGHPRLLRLRLVAEAGTYIKEWVHGEVGRTTPSLRDTVPVDILALDVTAVQLDWPPAAPDAPAAPDT